MLLELAIGDAYGAGFEFAKKEIIDKEHTLTKYCDSRIDKIKAGQYTDDTQMTLAIMEMMITGKEWTFENITESFIKVFQRDKRQGYAKRFYQFLIDNPTVESFLDNIQPDSKRNGSAMRSVPLSFISDKALMLEMAKVQSLITHATDEGIWSSQAVALIGHYFIYEAGCKEDLKDMLYEAIGYQFDDNKTTCVPCDGIETIDGVITVLKSSNTYKEILDKSVKLGGDTDSVASIALGLATLTSQFKNDLPAFLYNDLENGKYGKDYLIELDALFLSKFGG